MAHLALARSARPLTLQSAAEAAVLSGGARPQAVRGLAQALEYPAVKALTLAQNRAAELSNEEQAHQGAEGHAEAVLAAWARVAPVATAQAAHAGHTTQEAAIRLGPPKTKTSWES
jgi:hypothetical protein